MRKRAKFTKISIAKIYIARFYPALINPYKVVLPIKDFLVDFLICVCISFMALKTQNFFLSGLILINAQPSSFSIAFCVCIS